MLLSAEVRWFKRGAPSEQLAGWFATPECGGGQQRLDVYVVDKASDELGIKRREGRPGVEIKALVHPAIDRWTLGPVPSAIQLWTRCTSSVLDISRVSTKSTYKTRLVRKFDTSGSGVRELRLGAGPFREDPLSAERLDLGCHVELASVEIDGEKWSTFGIQSFAEDARQSSVEAVKLCLLRMFRHLNDEGAPFGLGDWEEKSYPHWLMGLNGVGDRGAP